MIGLHPFHVCAWYCVLLKDRLLRSRNQQQDSDEPSSSPASLLLSFIGCFSDTVRYFIEVVTISGLLFSYNPFTFAAKKIDWDGFLS